MGVRAAAGATPATPATMAPAAAARATPVRGAERLGAAFTMPGAARLQSKTNRSALLQVVHAAGPAAKEVLAGAVELAEIKAATAALVAMRAWAPPAARRKGVAFLTMS